MSTPLDEWLDGHVPDEGLFPELDPPDEDDVGTPASPPLMAAIARSPTPPPAPPAEPPTPPSVPPAPPALLPAAPAVPLTPPLRPLSLHTVTRLGMRMPTSLPPRSLPPPSRFPAGPPISPAVTSAPAAVPSAPPARPSAPLLRPLSLGPLIHLGMRMTTPSPPSRFPAGPPLSSAVPSAPPARPSAPPAVPVAPPLRPLSRGTLTHPADVGLPSPRQPPPIQLHAADATSSSRRNHRDADDVMWRVTATSGPERSSRLCGGSGVPVWALAVGTEVGTHFRDAVAVAAGGDAVCWRCGERGHRRDSCTGRRPHLFCSRCGRVGVMTRDCHPEAVQRRSRDVGVQCELLKP